LLHYSCIGTGAQNGFALVEERMVEAGKSEAEVEAELERRRINNSNAGTCISYASLFILVFVHVCNLCNAAMPLTHFV
jgi:hypothetical protein